MNGWQETKFGELVDEVNGFAFKSANFLENMEDGSLPVLKIKNVANGNVHLHGIQYHEYSQNLLRYVAKQGDVLIALTGNHPQAETQVVGLVSRYKLDRVALINQRVAKIVSKNEETLSIDYVYYFLKDTNTHLYLASQSSGSANQANISKSDIENIPFLLPPQKEQKAIATVLSSLDDKIDLLHRQNKTLEAMAETLFRQWFVEEALENWEEVTIGDFVELNRVSIDKNYPYQAIEYLDTGSLTEGKIESFQSFALADAPSRAKRLVQHNDVLISTVRPDQKHYGIIKNPIENLVVSTGFCVLTCTRIDPHFIYLLLINDEMTDYLHTIAEGSTSTYPSLKPSDIGSIAFQLPPHGKLEEFSVIAQNSWEKIEKNHIQIRSLETLRDTLLPKLMSGEVRVTV